MLHRDNNTETHEFTAQPQETRGCVNLLTTFDTGPAYRALTVQYILVEGNSPYNVTKHSINLVLFSL